MGFHWGGVEGTATREEQLTHMAFHSLCGKRDWPRTSALTVFKLTVNELKL